MAVEDSQRIVIAGGGIAGLATWRALKQRDIASLVVERRPVAADGGLAINLPGNAIAALEQLGLSAQIARLGHPVRKREYRSRDDRLLAAIDEDSFWGATHRPRAVRRADLMAMLGNGMEGSELRSDRAIASVQQDPSTVHVRLDNDEQLSTRLLVGADGVRSTVRQAVMGASQPSAAHIASASWRFMAPNPGVDGWTVWTGEHGTILLLPIDDATVYGWVAVSSPNVAGDDLRQLDQAFRDFPERVRKALAWALAHPESLYHSPIEEVRLSRWSEGRVVLLGDAAHATAPVWAEGAALAMEDALALAGIVSDTDDMAVVGQRFEQARQPRVAHVQAMTDRLSKSARLPYGLRRFIMPFVVPRSYRATYTPLKQG
ncbi:FAD-binding monooxygenase [Luteibacter rhizovicinus DSM 16549]|uniref:FAD-binding monooxygenase n=1 Tax=Luteibacter rhizovicinus DSM 16549 TaxID=1440763 RepID=A0A1L3ESB0_9GAMM|nr:NAD(P)/FAD-dependent oxidoreductase [Luteibacter rhizovicinus]APG03902.1 FAD-binding monooxygenase [Luteibacter rhizovicinus DSM 16549]